MMQPISRRGLLGKGAAGAAVVAAAVALPASAQPADTTPRPCCPCRPPAGVRQRVDEGVMAAAWDVLINAGPEVRAAAFAYDQQQGNAWMSEYEMMAIEFGRHFPGMETAVRLVADHIVDESTLTVGCACFD